MYRELGIRASYTLETSLAGFTRKDGRAEHLGVRQLLGLGLEMGLALSAWGQGMKEKSIKEEWPNPLTLTL